MDIALFWLILLGIALTFWRSNMRARETAVSLSRRACKSYDLQLLDDTVSLARIRIARDDSGRLALGRIYEFEYSADGHSRRAGSITLRGARVVSVYLEEATSSTATERPM